MAVRAVPLAALPAGPMASPVVATVMLAAATETTHGDASAAAMTDTRAAEVAAVDLADAMEAAAKCHAGAAMTWRRKMTPLFF